MAKRWTEDQKKEIIQYATQHSKAAAKRKYGVSVEAINYWTKPNHNANIKAKQREEYQKNHLNSKYSRREMRVILSLGIDMAKDKHNITEREFYRINQYITRTDEYTAKNRARIQQSTKKWIESNRDKVYEYNKKYTSDNKDKIRSRVKKRKERDASFKLKENIRNRMWSALKNNKKSEKTEELLGCTIDEFKQYLEQKFTGEMSWSNYGPFWHVDHIKPLSLFDLSLYDEQKKAFNYTNCQPLLAQDNIRKSNKYDEEIH